MKKIIFLGLLWSISFSLQAQCEVAFDEIDEFDSTRVIGSEIIEIGKIIPSLYELPEGRKFINQGKFLFTFSEKDSINSFFVTLAVPEYEYRKIANDFNVQVKLSDGGVIPIYNVPDRGTFDKSTNMRTYLHTLVIPLDLFYRLTYSTIEKIRINYDKKKTTIEMDLTQQESVRDAIQCVGRATGLYPVKP